MTGPLTGQPAVDQLVDLLDLEQIEDTLFRGASPEISLQRVFGGQVAAQALTAAGRTVPADRAVHSLHGYFIRPGDPARPIVYTVDLVRDGRSFTTRRVVAVQRGKPIFFMSASFHLYEEGLDHQGSMPAGVPAPDELPRFSDQIAGHAERLGEMARIQRPIDLRFVGRTGWVGEGPRTAEPRSRAWLRADGKLPADPMLHACVLTFASDMTLLDAVLSAHGETWGAGGFAGASLDHAIWFHRPFRADEWVLYDAESPSASGGRGLATGRMFAADGTHVATAVQEGLLRRVPSRP